MKVQHWLPPIYVRVPYHCPQARASILHLGLKESQKLATRLLSFPLACTFARWLGNWGLRLPGVLCRHFFCLRSLDFHGGIPFWLDGMLHAPRPLCSGSSSPSSSSASLFWLSRQLPMPYELFPSPLFPLSPLFPSSHCFLHHHCVLCCH